MGLLLLLLVLLLLLLILLFSLLFSGAALATNPQRTPGDCTIWAGGISEANE